MEKFIKQYGILVLVGVAVYWFFIRKKDEEEVVVVDEGDGSGYTRRSTGGGKFSRGSGGSGNCSCGEGNPCWDCSNGIGCAPCEQTGSIRRPRRPRVSRRRGRRY